MYKNGLHINKDVKQKRVDFSKLKKICKERGNGLK